jgi:hypothetical protein
MPAEYKKEVKRVAGVFAIAAAMAGTWIWGYSKGVEHPADRDTAISEATTVHRIGDRMRDGTILAGISPDTGKAIYTTGLDAINTRDWFDAKGYCEASGKPPALSGHEDWRVPTKGELNVLFQNRAAIGGFNESGSYPAGWYWSSSQGLDNTAWEQRFRDGGQYILNKDLRSSVRCVRG